MSGEDPSLKVEPATRWAHVRGALVLLHVVAVLVLALPNTGGSVANRSSWKNPTVQGELRVWASRLSSLGIDTDADGDSLALTAAIVDLDGNGIDDPVTFGTASHTQASADTARYPYRHKRPLPFM